MAETIGDRKIFSLLDVNKSIQKTLVERYSSSFWVTAEMNKLNHYSHSGHAYPELVEKQDGKVVALMNSHLWRTDYERINQKFLHVLQEPLKNGIKILFLASINYDPVYGISLWIKDIDPAYSLGELEKEKKETIDRLSAEGLFNLNKQLSIPLLPKRIAIISVETSKGFADFLKVLENNPFNYKFFHFLFPALLQGDRSIPSIIRVLKEIYKVKEHFDIVAIIRGGGGDVGLSSYNNYELSSAIARFPLPIITGIGHSTNETVSELVSYKNAITPTELADWLIQIFHNFSVPLLENENIIVAQASQLLKDRKTELSEYVRLFHSLTRSNLNLAENNIDSNKEKLVLLSQGVLKNMGSDLNSLSKHYIFNANKSLQTSNIYLKRASMDFVKVSAKLIKEEEKKVQFEEKKINLLAPENVLKRGFTITYLSDSNQLNANHVKEDETIITQTNFGKIESIVKKINLKNGK
jgi:exodeoxyribonuclease VII large subunit